MAGDGEVKELEGRLDAILATLMRDSHGSRSTLRIDDEARGWDVGFVCAEAVGPGVKSLRGDGSIDQRAAATVKWMVANRRLLLQPDLTRDPDPPPPPALMSAYLAKAQMLAPLFNTDDFLQGWISVHYVDDTRDFTEAEIAALTTAQAEVKRVTGIGV